MADLSSTTIVVTLAVALAEAVKWLGKAVMASMARPKDGNGKHVTGVQSGQLTPEEWEGRMRKMHEESEERIMADFRTYMAARNEEIRRIVKEEVNRK